MNALRLNPEYNAMLASTARTNPSRTQQPFMTCASERSVKREDHRHQCVWRGRCDLQYYDHYGMEKVWRDHPISVRRSWRLAS